jgi:hypothetical protein
MKQNSSGSIVKLGLLQHACTADPAANRKKRSPSPNAPPSKARKSSAPRNCSPRSISARAKTTKTSNSPNHPRPEHRAFQKLAKNTQGCHRRVAVRETHRRPVPQHRRHH